MTSTSASSFDIRPYTGFAREMKAPMSKKQMPHAKEAEPFGRRMARLRKAAGYSQRDLAAELGVSYRVIAYYEAQTTHPPTHLLPMLADALGLTADELLGRKKVSARRQPKNQRLLRQLRKVEKLPPRARQAVLDHIDALAAKYGRAKSLSD